MILARTAVSEIARRYREWVDIFEAAGAASGTAALRVEHDTRHRQEPGRRTRQDLQREFGFTVERIVDAAKAQLARIRGFGPVCATTIIPRGKAWKTTT